MGIFGSSGSRSSTTGGQTPLPRRQVAVLMLTRMAEPITYTEVVFPWINQAVEEFHITDNPDKTGFYSGMVESMFAFVQFFTVYHWAKLSDRIGRKPVILSGLIGVAISGAMIGFARQFWLMLLARAISGALNGNVAVIKASLGDITDESNSTEAFALYGLTWTVGSIIGNSIGGTLSHPFERFPALFGGMRLFEYYPFLLPCLVTTFLTVLGITFGTFYYQETLPTLSGSSRSPSTLLSMRMFSHKRNSSSYSNMSDTETLVGDNESPDSPSVEHLLAKMPQGVDDNGFEDIEKREWTLARLLNHRPVQILSLTMFLNQFIGTAWGAGSLLFFFDKNHGLGMSPAAIGTALAVNGFWSITCQLLFLTRIRRRFGIATAFKMLSFGWILVWCILPLLRPLLELAEDPLPRENDLDPIRYPATRGWIVTIAVNLMLSFVTFVGMTGSLIMVLINFSAPDRSALGAVNGVATAVGCMAKVAGPSLVSTLFAVSIDRGILGGRLWWIVMIFASIINFTSAMCVAPDHPGSAPLSPITEEDEDDLALEAGTWDEEERRGESS